MKNKTDQGEIDFKWIAKKLIIEVLEIPCGKKYFSLKWGESTYGKTLLGIPRKVQINGLNWADKNPEKALKILTN